MLSSEPLEYFVNDKDKADFIEFLSNLLKGKAYVELAYMTGILPIKKYKSEYSNIEFKNMNIFHDRFIIIDRKKLYSCGASFKDLGKKCFAVNEMETEELINNLVNKIFK